MIDELMNNSNIKRNLGSENLFEKNKKKTLKSHFLLNDKPNKNL
jgi:hypothetical protein